jgi:DNA (cytosine-5)-methyltransferase 1
LPDFNFFTGGFPCQAFSTAGSGKGELDTRGTLFHDIIRICKAKKPEKILLENVKGLISKRHKHTFETIIQSLENIGYNVHWELLNSKDYGTPQNRERVWIYATTKDIPLFFKLAPNVHTVEPMELYLDKNPDKSLYKTQEQILKGKNTKKIINLYNKEYNKSEYYFADLYNIMIKKNCPTLTEVHHNTIRIIEPIKNNEYQLRKLSIDEYYRLMGFKDGEIFLKDLSYTNACNKASNGWDINLCTQIIKNILK